MRAKCEVGVGDANLAPTAQYLARVAYTDPESFLARRYRGAMRLWEQTVLANKFSNLHLYGCWWFCNNPSIIGEMTAQRLEILPRCLVCRLLEKCLHRAR